VPRRPRPIQPRIERQPAPAPPAAPKGAEKLAEPPAAQTKTIADSNWQSSLAAWIRSRRGYPTEARRQGVEGVVSIGFVVARDGQITNAEVVHSSGSDTLDQAALAMFHGARAPAFPDDMASPQMSVILSIRYRLKDD
jgi:protein TonB